MVLTEKLPHLYGQLPRGNVEEVASIRTENSLIVTVDDDPAVLAGIEGLLDTIGAQVITSDFCGDPTAEIDSLINRCPRVPDLIIMDYRLPGGRTGIEVAEALRKGFGERVPVILLTGEISGDFLLEAQRDGFNVLHKPINADQLSIATKQALKSSRFRKQRRGNLLGGRLGSKDDDLRIGYEQSFSEYTARVRFQGNGGIQNKHRLASAYSRIEISGRAFTYPTMLNEVYWEN